MVDDGGLRTSRCAGEVAYLNTRGKSETLFKETEQDLGTSVAEMQDSGLNAPRMKEPSTGETLPRLRGVREEGAITTSGWLITDSG